MSKICEIKDKETLEKSIEDNECKFLINPIIIKNITAPVILYPNQLNNDLLIHMKNNLEELYKKRCFKDIGFIIEILDIIKYSEGIIYPEQNEGCVQYIVEFSCKMSVVIKDTIIIGKVEQINQQFILLSHYPYNIVVEYNNINTNKFEYISPKIKYINGDYINKGDYLKIKIICSHLMNGDTKIITLGYLEDIVNDKELEEYFDNIYSN